jgi:hypothetical protein
LDATVKPSPQSVTPKRATTAKPKLEEVAKARSSTEKAASSPSNKKEERHMPLNINIQIHISADATSEQIENIFAAMKKYLYD